MKPTAIVPRTKMVNSKGRRLRLLSIHNAFHSFEWFFFITIARRKGDISSTVSTPVIALAYQCSSQPGNNCRMKGSRKVNIRAIAAAERMLYTRVIIAICFSRRFHRLFFWEFG